MSNPKGDMDVSNAAVEHVYCPSKLRQAEDTMEIRSEGCKSGMVEREWVDKADGNAGHGIGPSEIPNKSEELVTVSIQLEDLGSSGKPRVCLGNRADGSRDHVDVSRGQMDTRSIETDVDRPANKLEIVSIP
ncbi:hypothetical protein SCLCIDRAFT_27559 [Scleroderma citrinum Foug A]|uniref:Uncharacterized protein n=1 Tax=Scleroderma citrinum Foug A TaxID=1036808 RepID=A0A0C3DEM7_9AGAM|nr:hypothetical protein SCLCIDRAFT_27559 [Scleroderma citrinum Foug A]